MKNTPLQLIFAFIASFAALLYVNSLFGKKQYGVVGLEREIESGMNKYLKDYDDKKKSTYFVTVKNCLIIVHANRSNKCISQKDYSQQKIFISLPEIRKLEGYVSEKNAAKPQAFLLFLFTLDASKAVSLSRQTPNGRGNLATLYEKYGCNGSVTSGLNEAGVTLHFKPDNGNAVNTLFETINKYKNSCRKR